MKINYLNVEKNVYTVFDEAFEDLLKTKRDFLSTIFSIFINIEINRFSTEIPSKCQ